MAVGEEYEARDTVQDSPGFSWEEEVEATDAAAEVAAAEWVLARAVALAAVLARAEVADLLWNSLK